MTASFFIINEWFYNRSKPATMAATSAVTAVEEAAPPRLPEISNNGVVPSEKLYLLETPYQQLVFSTAGGSLAEINLPLSTTSKESLVKPIRFDQIIQKEYPANARFPLSNYFTLENGSVVEKSPTDEGGYYPLIRRPLAGQGTQALSSLPARLRALATFDRDDPTHTLQFKVTRFEPTRIEMECSESGRKITKIFSLPSNPDEAPYCFDLTVRVEGDSRGLETTSGVPEVELISGSSSPIVKYRAMKGNKPAVQVVKLPDQSASYSSVAAEWISNSNGFLGILMQPLDSSGSGFTIQQVPGTLDPSRLTLIDAQHGLYPAKKYPGYELSIPVKRGSESTLRIFAGPYSQALFKQLDTHFQNPITGESPGFSDAISLQGWFTFISEPFAKFLLLIMRGFYAITGSWGFSIILLTVVLRAMLYPLNAWSISASLKMQQLGPEVKAIQTRYQKDPKRAQLETVALYRERKVNPLTGCLPILIQLPFLIAMFDLLKSTFSLRGASFIPGWIPNLTAPDVLFSWSYPLPFFGNSFHLLPFILGGAMWLQQNLSAAMPKDPKQMTDQQRQQRAMGNIMVVVFTVMFYQFPSGLNLYWLSSMLLGMLQQWWMQRAMRGKAPHLTLRKG